MSLDVLGTRQSPVESVTTGVSPSSLSTQLDLKADTKRPAALLLLNTRLLAR